MVGISEYLGSGVQQIVIIHINCTILDSPGAVRVICTPFYPTATVMKSSFTNATSPPPCYPPRSPMQSFPDAVVAGAARGGFGGVTDGV